MARLIFSLSTSDITKEIQSVILDGTSEVIIFLTHLTNSTIFNNSRGSYHVVKDADDVDEFLLFDISLLPKL